MQRLHSLGFDAIMFGWCVILLALSLPVAGGIATSPGQLVDARWLWAAAYVVVFGACLILVGYGLMVLVITSTVLVNKYKRWRHNRVWRRRI